MEKANNIAHFRTHNNGLLPFWYHSSVHVVLNSAIFVLLLIYCANNLGPYTLTSAALALLFFISWGLIEYAIHRFLLHGKLFAKTHFGQGHSIFHHGYFTYKFMNREKAVDINRVLLMPLDLLILLVFTALLSLGMKSLAGTNTALLCFFSGILYFITYEVLHWLCHTKIQKNLPVLKNIMAHHRMHHDLGEMNKINFSIVFPFIDTIFKTKAAPKLGFSWKVIVKNSAEGEAYDVLMKDYFPNLPTKDVEGGTMIGVYIGAELVGGVTLKSVMDLAQDEDIRKHWNIHEVLAGTRMLRLWAKRQHRVSVIPQIFKAICDFTPVDSYFYGILAIPLSYASKRTGIFKDNTGALSARVPLETCNWDLGLAPTSDGQKLMGIYAGLGAHLLGPASGCADDHTVRVPMGLSRKTMDCENLQRLYE